MTIGTSDADRAAAEAFPELRRLIDLREAGWRWLAPFVADGQVVQVQGFRPWPGGWVDVIRVRYTTDAAALRSDGSAQPGVVWHCEGGLAEVVDGLLSLPAPDAPGAPRLVRGTGPSLWMP